MSKVTQISFCGFLTLFSCSGSNSVEQKRDQVIQNQLIITSNGDSLESGLWNYEAGVTGVAKKGNYTDGFKVGNWTYKTNLDSVKITWRVQDLNGMKFNVPDYFKLIDSLQAPLIFQADIEDDDNNTYFALLKYDLSQLKLSVYDYLYQYNKSWETNSEERSTRKEFEKFTFRNCEVFRALVETEKNTKYLATSYIFVIDNFLYDLTYKCKMDKRNVIDSEIVNDILYSISFADADLFNFNSKKYLKVEKVEFK